MAKECLTFVNSLGSLKNYFLTGKSHFIRHSSFTQLLKSKSVDARGPQSLCFHGLLSRVFSLMSDEGRAPSERFSTLRTLAGTLPAVESLMYRQVRVLLEGLSTFRTLVWGLLCVNSLVLGQT